MEDSKGKQVDIISPGVTRAEKVSNYQNLTEEEKNKNQRGSVYT